MRAECECQIEKTVAPGRRVLRQNVGRIERWIRLTVGIALVVAGVQLQTSGFGYAPFVIALGALNVVVGITRFCPFYVPFDLLVGYLRGRDNRRPATSREGSNR